VTKPLDPDEIAHLVKKALAHKRTAQENVLLRETVAEVARPEDIVGQSGPMRKVFEAIETVGPTDATVLVTGESGTGKELVARAIHQASPRKFHPLVVIHCGALTETLLESELFGHEKGAFTGADRMRRGRFELADGGTILLDEISEIAPALQAKLLRVLQENCFERVGSSLTQQVDVRVIATTNRNLERCVEEGDFRRDLFYRLNVVPIEIPPLRNRMEDLPELCRHFLHQASRRDKTAFRHIEPEALRALGRYDWPGNVRELQNILERAVVLEMQPGVITATTIEPWLKRTAAAPVAEGLAGRALAEIEKEVILSTLQQFKGHRVRTATALGIGVRTLGMKLKRWRDEGELVEPVGHGV
jgi:two-component system response regulator HydG